MSDFMMRLCEIIIYPCVAIWLFYFVYLILSKWEKEDQSTDAEETPLNKSKGTYIPPKYAAPPPEESPE